jgi:uncharacterized protein YjbI with pentapeptide repeats
MSDVSSRRRRLDLHADCERCVGLCCVAPGFSASADFAIDKPPGRPCPNLRPDFRCGIHASLRRLGFPGCAVYDCLGAGQKVVQVTFGGRDWRDPETARRMFDALPIMLGLHELLWYLTEALALKGARSLHPEVRAALDETERLTAGDADALLDIDMAAHRRHVDRLLLRASERVRRQVARRPIDRHRADLVGADLRAADLRAADLRGAYLIRADLREADLRAADMMGADLRAANVRGADLRGALFMTQSQLESARGDAGTGIPRSLTRPAHWR